MEIAPVCICFSLSAWIGVYIRFKPIIYSKVKLIHTFWCHIKKHSFVLTHLTKWEGKKAQSISDMSIPQCAIHEASSWTGGFTWGNDSWIVIWTLICQFYCLEEKIDHECFRAWMFPERVVVVWMSFFSTLQSAYSPLYNEENHYASVSRCLSCF